jgi:hypothetical protein
MKVIKFETVVECIDDVVCSEPWRFTEDELDARDPALDAKVAECGKPLRALLEPLADDFQRVTVEQLRRELWKYEGMVQALESAIEEAENPRLRGAELLESLGIDGAQ